MVKVPGGHDYSKHVVNKLSKKGTIESQHDLMTSSRQGSRKSFGVERRVSNDNESVEGKSKLGSDYK